MTGCLTTAFLVVVVVVVVVANDVQHTQARSTEYRDTTMDDSHQKSALGIIMAFAALGIIAVSLRLWARYQSRDALKSDDYLIIAALVCAVSQSVTPWYYVKTNYVGIHVQEVPNDRDFKQGMIWNFANRLFYNPTRTLVKCSVLMFLRRLQSRSWLLNSIHWGTLCITVCLFVAVLLVGIFQCRPMQRVFDASIPGKCIDQAAFYVSTAVLNLFTDTLVLSIPIIITWYIRIPVRKKIGVCTILCSGGVATAIGLWRLASLCRVFYPNPTTSISDPTYDIGFCSTDVEVNVAVIAACAPAMNSLVSKYLPTLQETSRRGTISRTYNGTDTSNRYYLSRVLKHAPRVSLSGFAPRSGIGCASPSASAIALGTPEPDSCQLGDEDQSTLDRNVDENGMETTSVSVRYPTRNTPDNDVAVDDYDGRPTHNIV